MEIPRETPWKIAENRTLKWGSSPPEHIVPPATLLSGLNLSAYDIESFYVKNVIDIIVLTFATHRFHFRSSQRRKVTTENLDSILP
jgi:hypothetical protein